MPRKFNFLSKKTDFLPDKNVLKDVKIKVGMFLAGYFVIMKNLFSILLVFFVVLVGDSCKDAVQKNEGEIIYSIEYLNLKKDALILNVLPETMRIAFKNNNTSARIEAGFGVFSMKQIYNAEKKTYSILLKIWNKKYVNEQKAEIVQKHFEKLHKTVVEPIDDKKIIINYNCQKAITYFSHIGKAVEVFYTNDIPIDHPNAHNHYNGIDGVLMDFQLKVGEMHMRMLAKEICWKKIENSTFEIPPDYLAVSSQKIYQVLKELQKQ